MAISGAFQILRRLTGAVGSSVGLKAGQLFSNQVDDTLYLGYGDDGAGNATSPVAIGGSGAFVNKTTAQTIGGAKAFTTSPTVPTPAAGDSSSVAAPTAFVTGAISTAVTPLAPKNNPVFTGSVQVPTPTAGDNSNAAASTSFVVSAISGVAQGIQYKPTAKYATTAPLPTNTYSNGVLTASANGALAMDGSSPAAGDIVLVKDEASAFKNGLYIVNAIGGSGAPFTLTRHGNMDSANEFAGAIVPVSAGSVNSNSLWLANPAGTVTVGTTAIPFTQLNGATDLLQGAGIAISGNTLSIKGLGSVPSGSLLKYDGTNLVIANAGTDYVAPGSGFDSGTA